MATTYDPTSADPGQIEKIPAGDLIIDPNVRTSVRLDKSFISSIRVYGFQQCPVGYRDDDGKVHITMGQRRTSAALEIGWDVVPIVVKPKVIAEHDRSEELRILSQLAENEQRESLTDSERVAGYKQLALLGVSDDQIARKTNATKQHVQTALAVAASDVATDVLQAQPITLEQAAYFVEFEDDPTAIEQLTTTLAERPEQIDHTASRLRKDRVDAERVDARAKELEAQGWIVHRETKHYGWSEPEGTAAPSSVRRPGDGGTLRGEDLTGYLDRHAVVYPAGWSDNGIEVRYFIGSLEENGLELINFGAKAPLTDDEKAARRQKREDKADMIAATTVRRAWIKELLSQKKLPDMSRWIAHAVLETSDALGHSQRDGNARDLAWQLLDLEVPSTKYAHQSRGASARYINENPKTAPLLTAAYAIAVVEDVIGDPKHHWAGMQQPELATYLEQLHEWGYTLAEVEQRLVDAALPLRVKDGWDD